jgi:S1-C subfamily serine protease
MRAATVMALALVAACGASTAERPRARSPERSLTTAQIVRRTLPSVVRVASKSGSGTGFVVGADGRIATSLHVVQDHGAIEITTADGRVYLDVRVVSYDQVHDLVVLKIPARGLHPLRLTRRHLGPGEPVVAIGNPLGLDNTVSDGVVSALRERRAGELIQISAPISPGSSGGPVLDDHGRVVGIATLVSTVGQNLNFATPVAYLSPLIAGAESRPLSSLPSRFAGQLLATCTPHDLVALYRVTARRHRSPRANRAAVLDLLVGLERCDQVGRVLMVALDASSSAQSAKTSAAIYDLTLGEIDRALHLAYARPPAR